MARSLLSSALAVTGVAGALTVAQPGSARADLIKLDMLTKACSDKGAVLRANCEGYIAGVVDMLDEEHAICLGDAKLRAVRDLVSGYLQSHKFPGETHAAVPVTEALKAGYACKKP